MTAATATPPDILERDAELGRLDAALRGAAAGTGSVVLISGEAGIGKTSLVRTFARSCAGRVRLLVGACDDLVTPRTLGPLRDAVGQVGGPLAAAVRAGDREAVLSALLAELANGGRPTVLVLEDVHWADDATLDVLRFVGRRVADLPALVVVTYRDEEVGSALQRVLGALGGAAVLRLAPARLSRSAVARLAGGTAATSAPLYRLTAGNPFFVAEMVAVAGSAAAVPLTVVDAVLARVQRLASAERAALEQLSVVPAGVELPLARALLGDLGDLGGLGVLAVAERSGLLEMRENAVAFRHELSRHAVESTLPVTVRMRCNARVLAALLDGPEPDPTRVVHHAAAAGDEAAVVAHAPVAARAASRVGAHAQEVALQEQALRHRHLLDPADEAALWQERAMALFTLDRVPEALDAGRRAAALYERLGESGRLAEVLVTLALAHWALVDMPQCLAIAERAVAVAVLEPGANAPQHAYALAYLAGLQASVDRDEEAYETGTAAVAAARRTGAAELVALGELACGNARLKRGDLGGADELRAGIARAAAVAAHVVVMTGYVLLVEGLWNLGVLADTDRAIAEASAYAQDRDVGIYLDDIEAHGFRLRSLRGEWEAAEAGLRRIVAAAGTGGVRYSLPELSRLLVRRGADDAEAVVDRAVDHARRTESRYELAPALMARVELAWLTGRPDDAREAVELLAARTATPGAEWPRADLLRWRRRLAEPDLPATFAGCPPEYAAGLRGDWRTAAAAFAERGMPYEQALELADSGEVVPTLEGLRLLDDLGARPAAAVVRRRLRELGVSQVPRGPTPATRANPAGLTERQVEILRLVVAGRTNAEIAARLVLSIRTVDHHVSAVLQKLGVTSRREVGGAADRMGLL